MLTHISCHWKIAETDKSVPAHFNNDTGLVVHPKLLNDVFIVAFLFLTDF